MPSSMKLLGPLRRVVLRIIIEVTVLSLSAAVVVAGFRLLNNRDQAAQPFESLAGHLPEAGAGVPAKLSGFKAGMDPLTIILVTTSQCRYCSESIDFHRRVIEAAGKHKVPLRVLVPLLKGQDDHIKALGIQPASVRPWTDLGVSIQGTPAILFVDRNGDIARVWYGRLRPSRERELLDLLASPAKLDAAASRLGTGEPILASSSIVAKSGLTVIDVRERQEFSQGHSTGSANIPLSELHIRAPFELKSTDRVVLDCSFIDRRTCQIAADTLSEARFPNVAVLNGPGIEKEQCRFTAITRKAE